MRTALRALLEALFRVLFTYDCFGEGRLPADGPAIVAANHPSYLDPVLLSLQVRRPIHFLAWDALFRVPLLGPLLTLFGAIPVDVRRGRGHEAYERARQLVEEGRLVGIFPEGRRSQTGWMEPELRAGAARLALETSAPLFPATISGAFRAWPHYQSLPRPAKVRVRYHEPILPGSYGHLTFGAAEAAILAELRRRVDRSLLPGVKRDLRINVLYRKPAPFPRPYEWLPAFALALLLFWRTRSIALVWPAYAYLGYLVADHYLLPQRRLLKWLRTASPLVFLAWMASPTLETLSLPPLPAQRALAALLAGAALPYLYERTVVAVDFVRGAVVAFALALGALYLSRTGLGPHAALTLFAAAYAWQGRTVFWRYASPVLAAYAVCVPWVLGGHAPFTHLLAGLLAAAFVRLLPHRPWRGDDLPDQAGPGAGDSILRLDL